MPTLTTASDFYWPDADNWTRRYGITRRPWASTPITPRPITTWALPWWQWDASMRPSGTSGETADQARPCRCPLQPGRRTGRARTARRGDGPVQGDPENQARQFPAHNNLGVALRIGGRTDEAMEHFRKAWKSRPTTPKHTGISVTFRPGADELDKAIEHYQKALDLAEQQRKAALVEELKPGCNITERMFLSHSIPGPAVGERGSLLRQSNASRLRAGACGRIVCNRLRGQR